MMRFLHLQCSPQEEQLQQWLYLVQIAKYFCHIQLKMNNLILKILQGSTPRSAPSPSNILSRAESISSLEFRTSTAHSGISRGPSPLTLGMSDTIPLAVAFQELCHAYFRGTDESRYGLLFF